MKFVAISSNRSKLKFQKKIVVFFSLLTDNGAFKLKLVKSSLNIEQDNKVQLASELCHQLKCLRFPAANTNTKANEKFLSLFNEIIFINTDIFTHHEHNAHHNSLSGNFLGKFCW